MMTSLCHGTLASASALALQGVALALESVALLTSLGFTSSYKNIQCWLTGLHIGDIIFCSISKNIQLFK